MSDDVLEWGSAVPTRPPLTLPRATPFVLAGLGAAAFFASLANPWRTFVYATSDQVDAVLQRRPDYALTVGLGTAYVVAGFALAALVPLALYGSLRQRRVATGVTAAVGTMALLLVASIAFSDGKDSVYYEFNPDIQAQQVLHSGIYAAFASIIFLVAATVAVPVSQGRRRPAAVELQEHAPLELTVTPAP